MESLGTRGDGKRELVVLAGLRREAEKAGWQGVNKRKELI